MSKGSIYYGMQCSQSDFFESFTSSLINIGLSFENPSNEKVIEWTDQGDRRIVTKEELRQKIDTEHKATFQLWFTNDNDVCCTVWNKENFGIFVVEFDLNGVSVRDEVRLIEYVLKEFKRFLDTQKAMFLLVDRLGIEDTSEFLSLDKKSLE